jgi:hypothetical protein
VDSVLDFGIGLAAPRRLRHGPSILRDARTSLSPSRSSLATAVQEKQRIKGFWAAQQSQFPRPPTGRGDERIRSAVIRDSADCCSGDGLLSSSLPAGQGNQVAFTGTDILNYKYDDNRDCLWDSHASVELDRFRFALTQEDSKWDEDAARSDEDLF